MKNEEMARLFSEATPYIQISSEYCEPGWIIVCREHHGTVPGCKNFAVPECGLLCPPPLAAIKGLRDVTES